jgi:hypothetical protein
MQDVERRSVEGAEQLEAIRARVQRSNGDQRPSLTKDEVDARLQSLFMESCAAGDHGRRKDCEAQLCWGDPAFQ